MVDFEVWDIERGPLEGWWALRVEDDKVVGASGGSDAMPLPARLSKLSYYDDPELLRRLSRVRKRPIFGQTCRLKTDGGFVRILAELEDRAKPSRTDRFTLLVGAVVLVALFNPLTLMGIVIYLGNR